MKKFQHTIALFEQAERIRRIVSHFNLQTDKSTLHKQLILLGRFTMVKSEKKVVVVCARLLPNIHFELKRILKSKTENVEKIF